MDRSKNIILGISGGIAAYKCPELIRLLGKAGAEVHTILTTAGSQFVTPLTLQTLSGNPVYTNMFELQKESKIGHISLAEKADLVIVAPATADLIAKVTCGICDDLLTTMIAATKAPILFCPSMNAQMWDNPIIQENIGKLKKHGYHILEPEEGELACGYMGKGRLPNLTQIVNRAFELLVQC